MVLCRDLGDTRKQFHALKIWVGDVMASPLRMSDISTIINITRYPMMLNVYGLFTYKTG